MLPSTNIELPQVVLISMLQSVVALSLNLSFANTVFGFTGKSKVPKSQTNEPVAPRLGKNVTLFGVGIV
jgi:hypothetical protein